MPADAFFWYFALISLVSAGFVSHDKTVSKIRGKRRVPEKAFWILALLGGSIAMYIAMIIMRHKTKHRSFMIGIPVIIVLQIAAALVLERLF